VSVSELYEVVLSKDRDYRYVWRHRWDDSRPPLLVAGLIPSMADAKRTDGTVGKCIAIAEAPHPEVGPRYTKGYGGLVVVNMFAKWPTPRHMQVDRVRSFDLVGIENDQHVCDQARTVRDDGGTVVAAWGGDGWSRHGRLLVLLGGETEGIWCFGTASSTGRTGAGFPNHAALRGVRAEAVVLKRF
jgi:hypothetical protein